MTLNEQFGIKYEDNTLVVRLDSEQFKGLCLLITGCTVIITIGIVWGLRYV